MKFFEIISAGVIVAAESSPVPADRAQFFGSITKIETNVEIPQIEQCCTSLKVWGDVALFSGRFNLMEKTFNNFPTYEATAGELKLFFNSKINKWTVSDTIDNESEIRAVGGSQSCPAGDKWEIYNGTEFEVLDLTEPWVPYVASNELFQCRPEEFSFQDLQVGLYDVICNMIRSSGGVQSSKYCREADQVISLTLADWEKSSDRLINADTLLTTSHIVNLDQWHSVLTTIIFKRSWDMDKDVTNSLKQYVAEFVGNLKSTFAEENWTKEDQRFKFLYV